MTNQELLKHAQDYCAEMLAHAVDKDYIKKSKKDEYFYLDVATAIKIRDWIEYLIEDEDRQDIVKQIKKHGAGCIGYVLSFAEGVEGFDEQMEDMIEQDAASDYWDK